MRYKDWSWDITGNITTMNNKVLSLYKGKGADH